MLHSKKFKGQVLKQKIKYLLLGVILFLIIDVGRYIVYPDIGQLQETNPIPSAFMEYRMDEWKEKDLNTTLNQQWVALDKISPFVIKAVLISEDDKFWKHEGFDTDALESAFEKNLKTGKFAFGGSTISQQLSKNLYLSPSKNPIRKVKEAIITYRIEKSITKKRIIEIYLNIAEWGDGIFGIEAASQHYFHKSAKNLSAMEAAKLASVLPNPIIYNPIGNQEFVTKKSKRIYKIMLRRGIVIPEFKEIMMPETKDENNNTTQSQTELNATSEHNITVENNQSATK